MNTTLLTRCALAALLLAGCAGAPTGGAGLPLPAPGPAPANVHPGFDTGIYPGEATLRTWRQAAPYRWIGYYLPAPCHRETSWVGARPAIERLGYGIAILYVGQQAFDRDTTAAPATGPIVCSRTLLTAERGRADALDAIARAAAEGFAAGSVIYQDVEQMRSITPEMAAYYGAWQATLLADGRYTPGTYAHRDNATGLYALAQAAWQRAGRGGTPPFWIAGGRDFSLQSPPYASGFPFASIWQGVLDVRRTWGGVTLQIDENTASRPDPSAPLRP